MIIATAAIGTRATRSVSCCMSAGVLKVAFLALTVPDDEMTGPLMSVAMTTSRPLAVSKHISATVTNTMEHADNRILRIRVEKSDLTLSLSLASKLSLGLMFLQGVDDYGDRVAAPELAAATRITLRAVRC